MACEPIGWRPGNRPQGFLCGPGVGKGRRKGPPCACGRPGVLLCDGPPVDGGRPWTRRGEPRTCDASLCEQCAVQIRNLDVDLCPRCARLSTPPGCLVGPAPAGSPARCLGALVGKAQLCVRHAVLFDHWMGFEGGEQVYADPQLNREQRRARHRAWLRGTPPADLILVLRARRAPVESGPAEGADGE